MNWRQTDPAVTGKWLAATQGARLSVLDQHIRRIRRPLLVYLVVRHQRHARPPNQHARPPNRHVRRPTRHVCFPACLPGCSRFLQPQQTSFIAVGYDVDLPIRSLPHIAHALVDGNFLFPHHVPLPV